MYWFRFCILFSNLHVDLSFVLPSTLFSSVIVLELNQGRLLRAAVISCSENISSALL